MDHGSPPTAYAALLTYLLQNFPGFFLPVVRTSPASTFFISDKPTDSSRLPQMVLSSSARKALSELDSWLSEKRGGGKSSFSYPPSCILRWRYSSYNTREAFSLGVAASFQGDFSGLIDMSRRSAFAVAKVMFSPIELNHLLENLFRVLEVVSFLDWLVGALACKIKNISSLPETSWQIG